MAMKRPIDEEILAAYLDETLPADEMARVEKALRDSAMVRDLLETVRRERSEGRLHSLGEIWIRNRLTCPTRQQLGSHLLDVLPPEMSDYIAFHLDVVACPFCRANLDDLKSMAARSADPNASFVQLRERIVASSRKLLPKETRDSDP